MPSLPQRKVGIVACSGEELPEGTVTRLAALKVLEELRPNDTVTICLPLFLAGGEGDRAFAKFYPTIAVDGCEKRCAARATELYSNKPAASLLVDDIIAERGLPRPQGLRRLSSEAVPLVDALAEAIAAEVDRLMDARWSRAEGKVLELETGDGRPQTADGRLKTVDGQPQSAVHRRPSAVSSAACACGSGIPVTAVQVNGHTVQLMALDAIFDMAYGQGLRAAPNGRAEGAEASLPAQLLDTMKLYNPIPPGEETLYTQAVALAWQSYCAGKEQVHG